jgi:hypothetical protein
VPKVKQAALAARPACPPACPPARRRRSGGKAAGAALPRPLSGFDRQPNHHGSSQGPVSARAAAGLRLARRPGGRGGGGHQQRAPEHPRWRHPGGRPACVTWFEDWLIRACCGSPAACGALKNVTTATRCMFMRFDDNVLAAADRNAPSATLRRPRHAPPPLAALRSAAPAATSDGAATSGQRSAAAAAQPYAPWLHARPRPRPLPGPDPVPPPGAPAAADGPRPCQCEPAHPRGPGATPEVKNGAGGPGATDRATRVGLSRGARAVRARSLRTAARPPAPLWSLP